MALLACPAKIPLMRVVVRVTGNAGTGKRDLCYVLLAMARRTGQSNVRSSQREVRLLTVVEPPDRPAVWRVAGAASGAKTALMMGVAVAA